MDATKPTDVEQISAFAAYIREARAAVNALSAGTGVGVTVLDIAAGAVSLTVGTDVGRFGVELVLMTADGAVSIANILGGTEGQIKIFLALDNDVDIVDGLQAGGAIYLNQLPALSSYAMQTGDVLALVNVDGDGSTVQGFWRELFRQTALK